LKFEQKKLPDHQIEIIADCEPEKLNQKKIIASRKISSESKIPGFRPGKAPYDVVRNIYGDDVIEERAIELLIEDIYPQIIKEAEIKPYGPGKLDEIVSKDPPKFKFIIPLEPSVELGDYKSIRQIYKSPEVSDDDTKSVFDNLQLNYATAEEVSRSAEPGDLVSVEMDAFLNKPDKDQDAQILKETPHQVIIGGKSDDDQFPFSSFSDHLLGVKPGEEVKFKYKYPKDTRFENLKGKEVNFSVKVENVKKLIKPDLDDDFAKTVGFESLESLNESIKKQIMDSKKSDYENEYFNELFDHIKKISTIAYPPQMLEDEIADVMKNFEKELALQNLDVDTYLKINNREKEEFFENEIKPAATKRLEEALIIEQISKQEKIELDRSELQKEFSKTMNQIQAAPNYKKLQKAYTVQKLSNIMAVQTANRLMNRQTMERMKAIANDELTEKESLNDDNNENSNKNMMIDN